MTKVWRASKNAHWGLHWAFVSKLFGCVGGGDRAGPLPIGRLAVLSLAVPVCMPKYPWARYCIHLSANVR